MDCGNCWAFIGLWNDFRGEGPDMSLRDVHEMAPWLVILALGTVVFVIGLWFQHNERKSRRQGR